MVFMTHHPLESSAVVYKPTERKDDSEDSRTTVLIERGLKCTRAAVVNNIFVGKCGGVQRQYML